MSRVLVTGASGFIGTHVSPRLRAAGHEVFEVRRADGDIAERATWDGCPAADVVVHLAASSFVPDSWASPALFLRTNVIGTVGALEYCRAHRARLVFPSSYIYGDAAELPVPESATLVAKNPYALSKKLAEEACEFFADRFAIPVTILRLFNIYGPGQPNAFLVPTIASQLKAATEVRVKDLAPRRDYVYVRDVVEAMMKAVDARRGYQVHNLGYPSRRAPIEELAENVGHRVLHIAETGPVNVVTHSMGGIVLRAAVAAGILPREAVGRVVMLAPPNHGSELADRLRDFRVYRLATGPAGQQIGTNEHSVPRRLPAPYLSRVNASAQAGPS